MDLPQNSCSKSGAWVSRNAGRVGHPDELAPCLGSTYGDSVEKCFESRQRCSASADVAWQALADAGSWLPELKTVRRVQRRSAGPMLVVGSSWDVWAGLGPAGRATVTEVDEGRRLHTSFRFGPLRSELDAEIHPQASGCELVRRQCYTGLVGRMFTLMAGRREASEAAEYVRVWARYAENASAR
jgi:hypothetical protein